jgi:hypothetical protein
MTKPNRVRLSPMWKARIDGVLPYLERITAPGFEPMVRVSSEPLVWPHFDLSPLLSEFVQALYEHEWVDSGFNWGEWQDEARTWLDPARPATADVQTIRQLFTTHVRKDRFCEGRGCSFCPSPVEAATTSATRSEMASGTRSRRVGSSRDGDSAAGISVADRGSARPYSFRRVSVSPSYLALHRP